MLMALAGRINWRQTANIKVKKKKRSVFGLYSSLGVENRPVNEDDNNNMGWEVFFK